MARFPLHERTYRLRIHTRFRTIQFHPTLVNTFPHMYHDVFAASAVLRGQFRRVKSLGMAGACCALAAVPVALQVPQHLAVRYAAILLLCVYCARKVVQMFRSRGAVKQISMEEHFVKYDVSGEHVQKCVSVDRHLWTRSCILSALKALAKRQARTLGFDPGKAELLTGQYRRAFRRLTHRYAAIDLAILAAVALLLILAPKLDVELRSMAFQAGFLAFCVAVAAEVAHVSGVRRMEESLHGLFTALSQWTLARGFDDLVVRPVPFTHVPVYYAQPWFAEDGRNTSDLEDSRPTLALEPYDELFAHGEGDGADLLDVVMAVARQDGRHVDGVAHAS